MKTLILCDRDSTDYLGIDIGSELQTAVEETGGETDLVVLNGDDLHPCLGCFQCWVKTPGMCKQTRDAANDVAREEIQSDAVVFVSRITYGGYSYDTKSFLDRSIQNISPYFTTINGMMRHRRRYARYPAMITLGYGDPTDRELETFTDLAHHNALNMRPPKDFVFTARDAAEIRQSVQQVTSTLSGEVRP